MSGEQEKQMVANGPAAGNNNPAAALPSAPEPVRPQTTVQPAKKSLFETFDGISQKVDGFENKTHLQLEVGPYDVKPEVALKRDPKYDEPNSSLDMAGLTGSAGHGFRYDWSADLFARETFGDGPLNPRTKTFSYGGEIETHVTAKEGPVSFEGRAGVVGGQEHFKVHLSKAQMDAQLAAQGVPPQYYPQAEATLEASLSQTTQPLVRGVANGYVDFDPKTYFKKGPFEIGLTDIGIGGDIFKASLDHGVQGEVCGTGVNFGNAVSASACEVKGHGWGYDDPQVHQGLQFELAIKPTQLSTELKQLMKPKKGNGR